MPPRRRTTPRVARPYDAAMKDLVGLDPATWLAHFGVPTTGPVSVVATDLSSTILMEADQVLRVNGPSPWLVHIEFQATLDPRLAWRMHLYSTLLERRHRVPVQSLAVLLRPSADSHELTGEYGHHLPGGQRYLTFTYDVVRVWEQPLEALLAGPLATLPLAPLVGLSAADAASVLRRIETRVRQEGEPSVAERVRVGTYLLLGLRFPQDLVDDLLQGVGIMAGALKESSTYQGILNEGREEGLAIGQARGREEGLAIGEARGLAAGRQTLLRIGTKRFGAPDPTTLAAIERVHDLNLLVQLSERVLDVVGWADLGLE